MGEPRTLHTARRGQDVDVAGAEKADDLGGDERAGRRPADPLDDARDLRRSNPVPRPCLDDHPPRHAPTPTRTPPPPRRPTHPSARPPHRPAPRLYLGEWSPP